MNTRKLKLKEPSFNYVSMGGVGESEHTEQGRHKEEIKLRRRKSVKGK